MTHWVSYLDLVCKAAACTAVFAHILSEFSIFARVLIFPSRTVFTVSFAVLTYLTARKYIVRWVFGHHRCIFADCSALTLYPMKFKPAICLPVFVCAIHIDALQRGRFVPTGKPPVKCERDVSMFNPAIMPAQAAVPDTPPEDVLSSVDQPEQVGNDIRAPRQQQHHNVAPESGNM